MSSDNNPSMIASHAQYVKGVAEETIGNLTSSTAWTESGRHDKDEAVAKMRAAHHDPNVEGRSRGVLQTEGKVERTAGLVTGCGGMVEDGEAKLRASIEN